MYTVLMACHPDSLCRVGVIINNVTKMLRNPLIEKIWLIMNHDTPFGSGIPKMAKVEKFLLDETGWLDFGKWHYFLEEHPEMTDKIIMTNDSIIMTQ